MLERQQGERFFPISGTGGTSRFRIQNLFFGNGLGPFTEDLGTGLNDPAKNREFIGLRSLFVGPDHHSPGLGQQVRTTAKQRTCGRHSPQQQLVRATTGNRRHAHPSLEVA